MDSRARAAMIRKVEKRIRAKYRKRCWLIFLFTLIVGIALGVIVCKQGWFSARGDVKSTAVLPTATAAVAFQTSTPEPVATSEVTPAPTAEILAQTEAPAPTDTYATEAPVAVQPDPTEDPAQAAVDALAQLFGLDSAVVATEAPVSTPTPVPTQQPTAAPSDANTGVGPTVTLIPVVGTEPTAVPTDNASTPVAGVTQDPNRVGTMSNPVRVGESYDFETQVLADGLPRIKAEDTSYETVRMSMTMTNYLMPSYFAEKYSNRYRLTGTEAGAAIDMTLVSSTGNVSVVPQSAVRITFENASGVENGGYQLMDAEIAGRYEVSIEPGQTQTVYKRFAYSAEEQMQYMVLTHYLDGVANKVYFLLESVEPEAEYPTLTRGDSNSDVKTLQERLVELGYLDGGADGIFGGKTESAIRAAQKANDMAETGVADHPFQKYIYSDAAVPAA